MSRSNDHVVYLNKGLGVDLFFSRLLQEVRASKQQRAPAGQWISWIEGLKQKGVKQAEIETSKVLDYLSSLPVKAKVDRAALLEQIEGFTPTIKRIDLGTTRYNSFCSLTEGQYTERLYTLMSDRMYNEDLMDEIQYRIEELAFDPSPLLENPEIVDQLEAELKMCRLQNGNKWDFQQHHFSKSHPEHAKNLLAHARFTELGGLFYIEEIQSDWAQKGRQYGWSNAYPRAPFVEHTEQWSGLVLRDLVQTAALRPHVQKVAWTKAEIRNGSVGVTDDGLAEFYDGIVRRMVEKLIGKAGGRVQLMAVPTKKGIREVMGFEMTDKVREVLKAAQPLFSRDALLPRNVVTSLEQRQDEVEAVLRESRHMLGDFYSVRFASKLLDASMRHEVAGKFVSDTLWVSLRAKSMVRVARHEAWHVAQEHMLLPHEKHSARMLFAPGSDLNHRTQAVLKGMGLHEAVQQCESSADECAAHAFSLWAEDRLDVSEPQAQTLFERVRLGFERLGNWISNVMLGVDAADDSAQTLFERLRHGVYAHRMAAQQRQSQEAMVAQDAEEIGSEDSVSAPRM